VNAGAAASPRRATRTGNRRAERRRAQRPSPRDAHARQGVHTLGRRSALRPLGIPRGQRPAQSGRNTTVTVAPTLAAGDFARLFDKSIERELQPRLWAGRFLPPASAAQAA